MRARKRLFLACATGIALIPALPVAAQSPSLGVVTARGVADPATGRPAVVVLYVTEPSRIDLAVFASSARDPLLTRTVAAERFYRFLWDGADVWGNPVPPGTYRLRIDCSCGRGGVRETVELRVAGGGGPEAPSGGGGSRPDPPTGLGVVASEANALSWTASPSKKVAAYRVYRSPDAGGSFQFLGEGSVTAFEDVPAEEAVYWYRVTAVDAEGRESRPTDAVSSDNVHMTEVVGPSGGTLAPTTGTVRLEVPAGALPLETTLTIDQLGAPPAPAAGEVAVSRSFEMGPSGTTFAVPATLTLELDAPADQPLPASHPADTTSVQYWTSSGWESLRGAAVDTATSTVEVPIRHLAMFGASGITVPHGNYSPQTNFCGFCHSSHNPPGPTLQSYPTESETCYQCHNSGQGTKVNEVQRVTFTGPWLAGDLFRLSLQDQETADIAFDADPAVTRSRIQTALLALPNIADPPSDGVIVTGTGPFDVTFQNGQGNQDVPQMLGRSFTSSAITVTTSTPGVGIWAGALSDLLGTFGETWPVDDTSTRTSSHPVAAPRDGFQVTCSDCHTPHKDPSDPQYASLLRRPDGSGGWLYTLNSGTPIGNQFCTLACHDSTSTYPAPFGDHTKFTGTAHDTETATVPAVNEQQSLAVSATGGTFTLTFRAGTTTAQPYNVSAANLQTALAGLTNVASGNVTVTGGPGGTNPFLITFISALAATDLSPIASNAASLTGGTGAATIATVQNGRAAQPTGDIRCLNCHGPHAEDSRGLTDARQETLCYSCHTAATPNTSGAKGGSWPASMAALFPGSNVVDAFATPNDYTADAVRIYHHPITDADQQGGSRTVECVSCHNSHLADRTDSATTSKAANPANVSQKWIFAWDFESGYLNRSRDSAADVDSIPEATEFCITCHQGAGSTAPLDDGTNVPYDIRMVNDGTAHELFDAATWADSNHAYPDAPDTYNSCDARGVTNANCVVTCTNCHDPHGSTNAFMLRETIVPPDYVTFTVTNATWVGGVATLEYLTPSGLACTSSVKTGCTVGAGVRISVSDVTWDGYNGVFITTNSAVGALAGPITYALSGDPDGAGVTSGSVAPPSSFSMTGWDGSSSSIRSWCLTCHIERGSDHETGACTDCHDHTISGVGAPEQL